MGVFGYFNNILKITKITTISSTRMSIVRDKVLDLLPLAHRPVTDYVNCHPRLRIPVQEVNSVILPPYLGQVSRDI